MSTDPFVIISSDGHVSPPMAEYRAYVGGAHSDAFESFLAEYQQRGSRTGSRRNLESRLDPDSVDEWDRRLLEPGRWEKFHTPERRLKEAEREGVVAEVLFPDFGGIPFQMSGFAEETLRGGDAIDPELEAIGMRAYNRWLVDFISVERERYAGMALVSWDHDVDDAVNEIRWSREAGLVGVILPRFAPERPVFHPDFEPIWNIIDELGLVVNAHIGLSATTNRPIIAPGAPHPAAQQRVCIAEFVFHAQNLLSHLIWGGVLERHPSVKCVFTEMGSGWVAGMLKGMDYVYDGRSFFRSDHRDVIGCRPSEYFRRQCYLGSSTLAQAEVAARDEIGLDRMMVGMDFAHHEGMLLETTLEYLRATLGAERVPADEARQLLGLTAADVFGFDLDRLTPIAAEVGLRPDEVLSPPVKDLFPRGDVHRPASNFGG